ncbi:MAG: EamA family transporter [Alphaproteobacteria bacterium]|nr:EamA family transporter [Alphaproteobacteria bacterium]
MNIKDICIASTAVFIWGSYSVAIKLGLEELPPFLMSSFRVLLPAIFIVPFFRPSKKHLKGILLLSVGMSVEAALSFTGMQYIEGGCATIIYQLVIPFCALLALLFFNDKLTLTQWLGMTISFAGVVMIAGAPSVEHVWAVLLIAGAAFTWSVTNVVVIKKIPAPVSPLMLVGWSALFSFPQLLLVSLLFEKNHIEIIEKASLSAWFTVLYLSIACFIIAQILWYYLIRKYPVTKIIPFLFFEPAIGLLLGYFILSEPLSWQKVLGCALVISGMILIELFACKKEKTA